MQRVFGIETEYGITVEGVQDVDVVAESIALVRSYRGLCPRMKWNYALEDPHRDARGFRARELLQDTDEASYFEVDRKRPLSFEEIKSDLVLSNGARFYNDHAHPEYSTPECTTLRELVAQDKAGERILAECMRRRNAILPEGQRVRVYKNNTDFEGHSYGCHDNYLLRRDVPWNSIVKGSLPFLVTRQIFAGAGKMGIEGESVAGQPDIFQISQRADFFSELVSIDTMNRRPLVNTRDEPHADAAKYRRFHVIIGDANMSEWATAMKIGTTALMLALIERGESPALEIANPIETVKSISRDQSHAWLLRDVDGRTISAVEVQRMYLAAAEKLASQAEDFEWVITEWRSVLDDLEKDPTLAIDRVDWVAKKSLIDSLQSAEQLGLADPWLQAIDLEFHNIDPSDGLQYELVSRGTIRRVVSEEDITSASVSPPETTRAYVRGRAVSRFASSIKSLQWDEVVFRTGRKSRRLSLSEPLLDPSRRRAVDQSQSLGEFIDAASSS